jgi:hypothetical protein
LLFPNLMILGIIALWQLRMDTLQNQPGNQTASHD